MTNPFFSQAELIGLAALRKRLPEEIPFSLAWFKKNERPLFLFGSGKVAETIIPGMFSDLNVIGLIDNNPALWGSERYGYRIFSPDDALRTNPRAVVVATLNTGMLEVVRQAETMGFDAVTWEKCRALSDPDFRQMEIEKKPGAIAGLKIWEDDVSAAIYRASIRFRATLDWNDLPPLSPGKAYFRDFVAKDAYRDFVDLGAYNGDTLEDFLEYTGGEYNSYLAFEPAGDALPALRAMAGDDPRVKIVTAAASDKPGMVRMRMGDGISQIRDDGEAEVTATTVDREVAGRRVTFLKMDIEGAEPEALRGALETIRAQRPALGISIYHRPEHLWEIPLWIRELGLGYTFRLRHHCPFMAWDTVCYALPG